MLLQGTGKEILTFTNIIYKES